MYDRHWGSQVQAVLAKTDSSGFFSPQHGGLIIWPPSVRPYVRTSVRPSVDSDFSEVYGSTGLKL